jgi:hypothetical protein
MAQSEAIKKSSEAMKRLGDEEARASGLSEKMGHFERQAMEIRDQYLRAHGKMTPEQEKKFDAAKQQGKETDERVKREADSERIKKEIQTKQERHDAEQKKIDDAHKHGLLNDDEYKRATKRNDQMLHPPGKAEFSGFAEYIDKIQLALLNPEHDGQRAIAKHTADMAKHGAKNVEHLAHIAKRLDKLAVGVGE